MKYKRFPERQILKPSKIKKEDADDNFIFYENDRKFTEKVEHAVEKEEIARFEQFLLFSQIF